MVMKTKCYSKIKLNQNKTKERLRTEYNFFILSKINEINKNIKKNQSESKPEIKEKPKSKIIPGSDTILEENKNFKIYKYPKVEFSQIESNNCKTLLMIGNAQNDFINSFINVYSNISYEDKIRYSNDLKENKVFITYNIKSKTQDKNYDIKIISVPNLDKDNTSLKKNLIELFKNKIPRNKLHYICFCFKENKIELNEFEKVFYRFFIYLFDFKDKLLFLISLNQNDNHNINNYSIHQFLNSNSYFIEEDDYLKPEYFSIYNKTIFENDENNFNKLIENIRIIGKKIFSSKGEILSKEKIFMIDLVFFEKEDKFIQKYTNYKKREKIIIIYYLVDLKENFGEDLLKLILGLYNNFIRENQEFINLNDNRITYLNDDKANQYIHLISKLSFHFNYIEYIAIQNCKIKVFSMISLEYLFSDK